MLTHICHSCALKHVVLHLADQVCKKWKMYWNLHDVHIKDGNARISMQGYMRKNSGAKLLCWNIQMCLKFHIYGNTSSYTFAHIRYCTTSDAGRMANGLKLHRPTWKMAIHSMVSNNGDSWHIWVMAIHLLISNDGEWWYIIWVHLMAIHQLVSNNYGTS